MYDVKAITDAIGHMNHDDLGAVIEAVKLRRSWLGRNTIRKLVVGDVVEFDAGRGRGVHRGTVSKVNRTTVAVLVNGYTTWRVPANLVRMVQENA